MLCGSLKKILPPQNEIVFFQRHTLHMPEKYTRDFPVPDMLRCRSRIVPAPFSGETKQESSPRELFSMWEGEVFVQTIFSSKIITIFAGSSGSKVRIGLSSRVGLETVLRIS